MSFSDHFGGHAEEYARFRPRYPATLYGWLAGLTDAHDLAWDCATGNGQAALGLAAYYSRVVATDASARQIAQAPEQARIEFREAPANDSGLPSAGVDLVAVAQALHWFDTPAFYAEVRRVLKPKGVCAAWGYGRMRVAPPIDAVLDHYYTDVVGPYWPPERAHLDTGYRTLGFPFTELTPPPFVMQTTWPLAALRGYLATWSASTRYAEVHGADPLARIDADLARAWGPAQTPRVVTWPLYFRVGRV